MYPLNICNSNLLLVSEQQQFSCTKSGKVKIPGRLSYKHQAVSYFKLHFVFSVHLKVSYVRSPVSAIHECIQLHTGDVSFFHSCEHFNFLPLARLFFLWRDFFSLARLFFLWRDFFSLARIFFRWRDFFLWLNFLVLETAARFIAASSHEHEQL